MKTDKAPLENAVVLFADYELEARQDGRNIIASLAAAELAAKDAELAALRAVVEAARRARIALTFYRRWMYENRDKTQYPFGKETEDELAAALARVDGEK